MKRHDNNSDKFYEHLKTTTQQRTTKFKCLNPPQEEETQLLSENTYNTVVGISQIN